MELIKEFKRPVSKIIKIHSIDYRHLLPSSITIYTKYIKYYKEGKSYDLYGYQDDILVDIYPTYNSIINNNDLPCSWQSYIKNILNITKMLKFDLFIYNLKFKKYTNVIHFRLNESIVNEDINQNIILDKNWVTASSIKNYIMEDTILDIINKKRKRSYENINIENLSEENINIKSQSEENINIKSQSEELIRMDMGNMFERDIIDILIRKYFNDFIKIGESYDAKRIDKYNLTINEMKKGTPIIHQAVLHNPEKQEYGCVDLLVRSDWIDKIFTTKYRHLSQQCNKTNQTNYVIIDIKFNKLQLNVDGLTIRNEGMVKVFKSQLCIYNNALGYMQGYLPPYAYILGSGWSMTKMEKGKTEIQKSNDPFDRVGIINYLDKDSDILSKTDEAVKWIKELNNNEFDENKPKYNHNYPNMSNMYDYPHKKRKQSIAEDNNELTLISYLTPKNRKIAIENGIDNFLHNDITVEKLGLKGKMGLIVDTLLKNQKNLENIICGNYKVPNDNKIELYLDYEFIPIDNYYVHEMIPYLCGIGYIDSGTNDWNINQIVLESTKKESQKQMCQNTIEVIKKISNNFTKNIRIYTWTDIDRRIFIEQCKKYNLLDDIKNIENIIEWLDGHKFCIENKINFKDAKGFNLKEIGFILNKHKLTDINWKNNLSKSNGAKKYYIHNEKWTERENVLYYNEIDCQIIYEIFKNLKKFQINI